MAIGCINKMYQDTLKFGKYILTLTHGDKRCWAALAKMAASCIQKMSCNNFKFEKMFYAIDKWQKDIVSSQL